eukprot:TRINITY_DN12191_c0_g1_i2.p1 TRINITY_DN12191_c0_g1~~TRINITY_DN12191_c0_g1_i2.p1  ORF type:complete len:378 (-),score=50.79 TRINITY_DN12191_c0_g1_i2:106-1239(-)
MNANMMTMKMSVYRRNQVHVVLFSSLMAMLCYLDRAIIGNIHDELLVHLNMTEQQYAIAGALFYPGYLLFEIPSCCFLEIFGARRWLSRILVSWGLVTVLTALCQTPTHLYISRLMLGLAEAGFFSGVVWYFAKWFVPSERSTQVAVLSSALCIAGILSGFISWLVLSFLGNPFLGISNWRWLFIIEGVPSIVVGLCALYVLPDSPAEAPWLSSDEKVELIARIAQHASEDDIHVHRDGGAPLVFSWSCFVSLLRLYVYPVRGGLSLATNWLLMLSMFFLFAPLACTPLFLPTIIQSFGSSSVVSNILSTVPYLVSLVAVNLVAIHSDAKDEKPLHIIATAATSMLAYAALAIATSCSSNFALQVNFLFYFIYFNLC